MRANEASHKLAGCCLHRYAGQSEGQDEGQRSEKGDKSVKSVVC